MRLYIGFAVGFGFGVAFGFRIGFGSSLSIGSGERLCAVVAHKFLMRCGMLAFCFDAWFTNLLMCLGLGLGSGLSFGLGLGFEVVIGGVVELRAIVAHKDSISCGVFRLVFGAWDMHLAWVWGWIWVLGWVCVWERAED